MIKITPIDINLMMSEILRLLPFFIPLIIIEYGLMIYALVQAVRNDVAYLPRWGWILIIVFFGIIGPVVFLIIGRKKDTEND